jgi:CheY-like chemotaxis protein
MGSGQNAGGKAVVLVVDDEPLLRMAAIDLVEEAGFEAIQASSADEAILLLESRMDIRVIFTDIEMPGTMNGLLLAAAVRRRWPPIKIIIVSGRQSPAEADMPEGSVFFAKPYPHHELRSRMEEFCR